ncbi:DNA-binding protein [Pseudoflavonifractor sp. An85]|uniref:DNA-binding protein n=1 Tax=Pseudoflavonifractor sp. An85 TaxID=1965661 RepID=UPI00117A7B75|nr:DNA-binding protein [Pseudoflavonifractor sp. An85]
MAALPRMRNAEGVIAELKAQDPGTKITLNFIRGLIRSGEIPVVQAGVQKLVNLDLVFDYLANQGTAQPIRYKPLPGERPRV